MAADDKRREFDEGVQRGFALDDALAFRRLMLDIYGQRCAVTGHGHPGDAGAEGLEVFLLQPLEHGGMMTSANAIVVEAAVASLLGKGLILISDDFLAYTPHPELVGARREPGELHGQPLTLPDNVSLWPERAMIGYHRSLFRAQ